MGWTRLPERPRCASTRTGTNLASGVTVQLTTTNGTATAPADYLDATQVLTFAAGETFKDVPITIVDDAVADGNRTVILTLSSPSLGARLGVIKTAVLTIRDDEQGLQFSAPTYVVSEATAAAMVTVVRTGPPVGTVTVDYASAAASATAGSDYATVSGTLTFSPGVLSRSFTVPITNDTRFEGSESLALLLNNPTGGAQPARSTPPRSRSSTTTCRAPCASGPPPTPSRRPWRRQPSPFSGRRAPRPAR